MRRAALVLVVVAVALAGCSGSPGSAPPLRAAAEPATVEAAAAADGGYEHLGTDRSWLNVTITARIQGDVTLETTRPVNASTVRATYRRETDAGPVVVGLYSVPGVQPFNSSNFTKNPAVNLAPAELVNRAQSATRVENADRTGAGSTTLLGTEGEVIRYSARTDDGRTVRVTTVTVRHHDDFVTGVLVAPTGVSLRGPLDGLGDHVVHSPDGDG